MKTLWKTIIDAIRSLFDKLKIFRSLQWRLMASFLAISLLPLLIVGGMAIIQSLNSSERTTTLNLQAIGNLKARQINTYFEHIQQDIEVMANLDLVRDSYRQMGQAYVSLEESNTTVRDVGFLGHPELAEAPKFSTYNLPHKKYHNFFSKIATVRNYTDIMLVSRDGDVIYSYAKQDDFGTNLKTGPYSNTALGRLLADIVADPVSGKIWVSDYEPYLPGGNAPVCFIGTPLVDNARGATGILIYKISVDQLSSLLVDQSNISRSNETYLVGTDKRMRTQSLPKSGSQMVVDTVAVREGLRGESGVQTIVNYLGEYVLSAYQPVKVQNQTWVLVTEMNENEAFLQSTRLLYWIIALIVLTGVIAAVAGYLLTNYFMRPILGLTQAAQSLSAGKLEQPTQSTMINRKDELGILANTFNTMAGKLHETVTTLEDRVAERTRRLEIVATLGEKLTAILSLEELLEEITSQIQMNFGYYHAHIYLFNEQRDRLVVAAGTGPAGAELKRRGHSIPANARTSLVVRAARTARIIRVGNVRESSDWLPNPLLPDTFSEIAVPIISADTGQVVGVLDVQENKLNGFDEGDESLLRTLANQVSIAIRNARLFENVQKSLTEAREVQSRYLNNAWRSLSRETGHKQHLYVKPGALPLNPERQSVILGLKSVAAKKERPTPVALEASDFEAVSLIAPVKLKDQLIGTLQLHSLDKARVWSNDDVEMITTVLDQMAQAAENLRLLDETNERAGREQTIREITEKLRSAPNLTIALNIAARELGQRLNVPHVVLELGNQAEPPASVAPATESVTPAAG